MIGARWAVAAIVWAGFLLADPLAPPAFAQASRSAQPPFPVQARSIDRFAPFSGRARFGALTFLGGLDLYARDTRFGGLSGIVVSPDGRIARLVSDRGFLFDAALTYDDAGRLRAFAVTRFTDLGDGLLADIEEIDTEDIAGPASGPGDLLLTLERHPDIALLAVSPDIGGPAVVRTVPVPPEVLALDYNRGIEAIALAPAGGRLAGKVLLIAERPSGAEFTWTPAWFLGGGRFEIRRRGYDITAARFLPDGDLVVLERRFTPARGVGMRLRRFAGADLNDGARLDGEVLMEAGMTRQIDNMEGLAVHIDRGRPVLTLISDNNANILQRTLILQFALESPPGG